MSEQSPHRPWVRLDRETGRRFTAIRLGRPLVQLTYNQEDHEADFRAGLVHVRENAETVAFLHREQRIEARLLRHLDALVHNLRHIIAVNLQLGFFTTGYSARCGLDDFRLGHLGRRSGVKGRADSQSMRLTGLFTQVQDVWIQEEIGSVVRDHFCTRSFRLQLLQFPVAGPREENFLAHVRRSLTSRYDVAEL